MLQGTPQAAGVALVTGASRGIGKDVALQLAANGFAVAVNYRSSREAADQVVRSIESTGGRALALQADLSSEEEAGRLVERSEARLGPLDVLVNNAGITRDRLVLQLPEQDWTATWRTDLVGPRTAARRALSTMMRRGSGRIVNLGSVVGSTGNAGQANYAAAKSAVLGLTRALAVEAAPHGVTVNCVIPGYVDTDATAHLSDQQRQHWIDRIPLRRSGGPRDVAAMVVYLVSPQASYITGQCIAVDGGLLAAAALGR